MGDKLRHPLVAEVVCEIQFDPKGPWETDTREKIALAVKSEFSERIELKTVGVQFQLSQAFQSPPQMYSGTERLQLKRADGSAMLQLQAHLLAINILKPYPGWEAVREMIFRAFSIYAEIAKPLGLARIGLRYVNLIDVPDRPYEINDYLVGATSMADILKRPISGFYQRSELNYEDLEGVLIHQLGMTQHEKKEALLVDLDFITSKDGVELNNQGSLGIWLEMAHDTVSRAFIASLNPRFLDKLR